MANTVKEKIRVDELSRFGFKVGSEYLNYSKKLSEDDKTRVVPGAEFEAELYVADSGKRYLNKILSDVVALASAKAVPPMAVSSIPGVDAERAKKFTPKFQKKADESSDKMSKGEWAAKDRSQLIGGLSHDAAAITAAFVTVSGELKGEAILQSYKFILEGMLKIREELK